MNGARVVYHIARADFLERIRRYSFLVMLGAVVFLGYQAAIGNFTVQLGSYRGEFNSAWVGSMLAIIASFMLGWFGFYLVKGSVARDRETGVGQIMATTPLTRPVYMIGKWLSNFAVFIAMVIVLAIAGIVIQIFAGESSQFDFPSMLTPFLIIALPMLALTAALAVLFESIGFLQGGFGNLVYFILFGFLISLAVTAGRDNATLDPIGFHVLQGSMAQAAKAAFPDYGGEFVIGSTGEPITGIFPWSGVEWTFDIALTRLMFLGVAAALALVSSIFFDRFDSSPRTFHQSGKRRAGSPRIFHQNGKSFAGSPRRLGRTKAFASLQEPEPVSVRHVPSAVQLTPLHIHRNGFAFLRVVGLELKLLFKGGRWWWYVVAAGFIVAALLITPEIVRAYILPITWLWPVLIWSGLGSREIRHNTQQMVFSAAAPLWRQLPAAWLAGFIVAVVTGGGAAVRLLSAGDGAGLLAWLSGALFIPSLALALGVWSKGSKLFEILHISLWYLIINGVMEIDYLGANSSGNVAFFIPLSLVLIITACIGRARQIQN